MTAHDVARIAPLVIVAATVVLLMVAVAVRRSHRVTVVLTLAGLGLALLSVWRATPHTSIVASLLAVDDAARLYGGLILLATAAVALLSFDYLEQRREQHEEYYMLLLLASLGGLILAAATHFVSFFLGLELLSVSLYGLIGYPRAREAAIEAALKYLVLAAISAAFLLFGIALLYAEAGSLEFARTAELVTLPATRFVALAGIGLILVGFGFKLALVPFHLWTPDVYQGAPAPVAAFVATVSKGAMFALLVRYFAGVDLPAHRTLVLVFTVLAAASMIGGNLLALLQGNVKRLLAYSSIAHLGYLLVAFLAGGALAAAAVAFYLTAYFITMIGAFGVVTVLSGEGEDAERLEHYRGLFARRPWLAALFAAMLLSLAGIPLTAGFVGKFYLTVAAGSAALWGLLVVMMLTSGIGLFYYLRVIAAMFMQPSAEARRERPRIPLTAAVTLGTLVGLLVWLGVYPAPLVALVRAAAG